MNNFQSHGYDSPIVEVSFAFASLKGNSLWASGSGVAIAKQLILSAKHVIQDHWDKWEDSKLTPESKGGFCLLARHYHSSPETGIVWTVRRFWFHEKSDLALFYVESGDPIAATYKWPSAKIQLLPPKIGDAISAFGYRESSVEVMSDNLQELRVNWSEKPTASFGIVDDIHADQRDSYMISFPSFRTDARFEPGMSGGPIFSANGRLTGIICSGYDVEGSEHISYGTSLWPLMGMQLRLKLEGDTEEKTYSMLDLAQKGVIDVEHLDKVSVTFVGSQINTTLTG